MENLKRRWERVPATIRRPIILIAGSLFIIAAGLTGWLPGPGGIPLFLIGVAILATEFEKAQRFRDWVLRLVHEFGKWYRRNRVIGTSLIIFCSACAIFVSFLAYKKLH